MSLYRLALVLLYYLPWRVDTVAVSIPSFTAAVYEHSVILPPQSAEHVSREEALELMRQNLAIYKEQAILAKKKGTDILVFPEDGIYGMAFSSRDAIFSYLESIPDPNNVTWSPCSEPSRFNESEVQHELSCMAKNNTIHVVANMGDKVVCDGKEDPKCPDDGRYQFNTVVVYDTTGTLIAKYHKHHLFFEDQFDTPEPIAVYFDTPYGRFGLAVCFDLLFTNPALTLVMTHNVSNILFPTAWMDALPLLPAIGYHSSFARGLGVNLLGANIHRPVKRFHGSGIYTPEGVATFYYNNSIQSSPELLISEIAVITEPSVFRTTKDTEHLEYITFTNEIHPDQEFKAYLFHDKYTFRILQGASGELKIRDGGVSCFLKYERENDTAENRDVFAFGAFDGLHTYEGQYYLQVCTLVRCANSHDNSSCGNATYDASTIFNSLYVMGIFETHFIYPQVVLSDEGQLELAAANEWNFTKKNDTVKSIESHTGFRKPLLSATLLGRHYSKDDTQTTLSQKDVMESSTTPTASKSTNQGTTVKPDTSSMFHQTPGSSPTTLGLDTTLSQKDIVESSTTPTASKSTNQGTTVKPDTSSVSHQTPGSSPTTLGLDTTLSQKDIVESSTTPTASKSTNQGTTVKPDTSSVSHQTPGSSPTTLGLDTTLSQKDIVESSTTPTASKSTNQGTTVKPDTSSVFHQTPGSSPTTLGLDTTLSQKDVMESSTTPTASKSTNQGTTVKPDTSSVFHQTPGSSPTTLGLDTTLSQKDIVESSTTPTASKSTNQGTTVKPDTSSVSHQTPESSPTTLDPVTKNTTNATTDYDGDSCHTASANVYYILLFCICVLVFIS